MHLKIYPSFKIVTGFALAFMVMHFLKVCFLSVFNKDWSPLTRKRHCTETKDFTSGVCEDYFYYKTQIVHGRFLSVHA